MSVDVQLSVFLRKSCGGKRQLAIEGTSVDEIIGRICDEYPSFKSKVLETDGRLKSKVRVFLNGEAIDIDNVLHAPVKAGDRLNLLSAIAGG